MGKLESRVVYNNKSLERALQILKMFDIERPSFGLAELSERLAMPKATVLRLCSTLLEHDFLKYDGQAKQYSLGVKLFELGAVVFASFSVRRIAVPFLIKLQEKLDRTVFLAILQDGQLVYIDKKENPSHPIRFASRVGTRRPPHFGMMGNVLMAHLSDQEVTKLLRKSPLTANTRKTLTDEKLFRERLALIRSQGYFVDEEEAMDFISGVAAPIRDYTNRVVAAVGVGFLSSSEDERGVKKVLKEVRRTAGLISDAMGHTGERQELDLGQPAK